MDSTATLTTDEPAKPPAGASPAQSRGSDFLQKQLREKDQLVAALTERLEQAAEQLDRLRRTGADKGHRPLATGGTLPPELLQDQKQTFDEIKRFIANWDQIQPGSAFERIESQVTEIRNLVAGGVQIATAPPAGGARERSGPASSAASSASPDAAKASGASWWEKQKAALLGEGPPPEETPAETSPGAEAPADATSAGEGPAPTSPPFRLGDAVIPDPPEAVDFENLTLDDAKHAIRVRDQVILQLREPLLLLQAADQLPQDLQSRDQLPPALRQRFDEFETQWQAKFRQAELELSLERARLAREQSQVRQQHEALQKQIKQGGRLAKENADSAEGEDTTSRRRWFRFMSKSDEATDAASDEQK